MELFMMILIGMVISFAGGFFVGEACCMNTYTECLDKMQRQFEKRLIKKLEDRNYVDGRN